MSDKTYCVYIHTNKINGMKYIGLTCQAPQERWRNGEGYRENTRFYRAIQKYGWENFEHEIVAQGLAAEEAYALESRFIAVFETTSKCKGYNYLPGGQPGALGLAHTEQAKRKMRSYRMKWWAIEENRLSRSGVNHPNYGQKMSDAAKTHLSVINRGKTFSEETRRKISEAKRLENHHYYGKFGQEHPGHKDVCQCDMNGNVIRVFHGLHEAQRETGIDLRNIQRVCAGRRKSAKGYIWKYVTTKK